MKISAKEIEVHQKLQYQGLRITLARKEVIHILMTEHGPFSAEELHERIVNKLKSKSNLSSIYRTLQQLEILGYIQSCFLNSAPIRYEWFHQHHHHHHLTCIKCDKSETISECALENLKLIPHSLKGYKNIRHKLEFYGVCPKCS